MKQRILKYVAFFAIISLITVACLPVIANAADYNYEKTGLKALYVGNNNTGSGQDKGATVWKDLSGNNNDIKNVPKSDKNFFNDTGYMLDSTKVGLPEAIKNIVNSTEFTVELAIGEFTPKGTSWNTLLNSTNDSFALFRTKSDNTLNFKSQTSTTEAEKTIKNSTITITFKLGGKITMYVNGVKVGEQKDAANQINCDDFYFGHNDASKNHLSEYRAMRFYDKELTAAQVKANYEVDKAVLGKAYGGTTPSSSSSSTAPSSSSSSSTSSTSSAASSSKASSSSSTTSTSNPKTGDNSIYVYAIIGFTALTSMMFVIRNRKVLRDR